MKKSSARIILLLLVLFLPAVLCAAELNVMPSLEREGRAYLTWAVQEGADSYAILFRGQEVGQTGNNFFAVEIGVGRGGEFVVRATKEGQLLKEMKTAAKLAPLKNKKTIIKVRILGDTFFVDNLQFFPCCWSGSFADKRNYGELERAFQALKEANYNVLIDNGSLDEYAAELAGKAGLLVLKQLAVPTALNYSDRQETDRILAQVKETAEIWSGHSNLLGFALANQPQVQNIAVSGLGPANEFFRRVAKAVQEIDRRPITIISSVLGDLLGTDMQEFVTIWYDPAEKNQISMMTLRGYLSWLKRYKASDKPLVILSPASATGDALNLFQEMLGEKINGFGLYQEKYNKTEASDLGRIFAVFCVYPCNGYRIAGPISPMVFTAKKPASIQVSFQDKAWLPLYNMWNWWRTEFETKLISDGDYNFQIQYGEQKKMQELNQKITVTVQNKNKVPLQVLELVPNKRMFKPGEELYLKIKLSEDGRAENKASLLYGVYAVYNNSETETIIENKAIETDKYGSAEIDLIIPAVKADGFLSLVVTTDSLLAPGQRLAERRMVQVYK
jgi:hypothetical protein